MQPLAASAENAWRVPAAAIQSPYYRWGQLAMGIVCMAMIANLQYGWTLFANPPALHKDGHALSIAFTVSMLFSADQKVSGIAALVRDESSRFAEERELRKRLAELEVKSTKAD